MFVALCVGVALVALILCASLPPVNATRSRYSRHT